MDNVEYVGSAVSEKNTTKPLWGRYCANWKSLI